MTTEQASFPAPHGSILVVDDDPSVRRVCAAVLSAAGYQVTTAGDGGAALLALEGSAIDMVLTDLRMPGISGLDLLSRVEPRRGETDVLVMTGHASIPTAVMAMRMGALDYLEKPLKSNELLAVVERVMERRRIQSEAQGGTRHDASATVFAGMVGRSARMQGLFRQIGRVAERRQAVLITGESGTGKELAAQAIHELSPWSREPFVVVDCGGLARNLIESELFGHVRGAFTGAVQSRPGLLAQAGTGTLFIDEVGELSLDLQVKLLRVLQERQFRALGGDQSRQFLARIVAATNVDLEAAVARGSFRRDLYYRLNVYRLEMPPVRERKGDVVDLLQHFLLRSAGPGDRIPGLTAEAQAALLKYHWPGNVRELENCALRLLSQGESVVELADLPREIRAGFAQEDSCPHRGYLAEVERKAILDMLEVSRGNCAQAASLLGVAKTTVYRKLKEYGVEPQEAQEERVSTGPTFVRSDTARARAIGDDSTLS